MITVFPCARKILEKDIPTFICQSKSLSISASTSNLNYSVAKEHFNLQKRETDVSNTLIMFLKLYKYFQAVTLDVQVYQVLLTQDPTLLSDSYVSEQMHDTYVQNSTSCSK